MKQSNVYSEKSKIVCSVCGKDLLENPDLSMVNIIQNTNNQKIVSVKPCCKGSCDRLLQRNVKKGEFCGWKELTEFLNPYLFLKHFMAVVNSMQEGNGFDNTEAFEDYKKLILDMYPYITRDMTEEEQDAAMFSNAMPF